MYTTNLLFTFLFPHFMSEIEIHTDSWAYRILCDNQYMYLQKRMQFQIIQLKCGKEQCLFLYFTLTLLNCREDPSFSGLVWGFFLQTVRYMTDLYSLL